MLNIKRIIPFLILSIILAGSAFAINSVLEMHEPDVTQEFAVPAPPDSLPVFRQKSFEHNTAADLSTSYPLEKSQPENIKSVVEYDPATGNYVFKTYAGSMEIATPFMMTGEEYNNFSAKREMQDYWKEKNASAPVNNEDKFSVSDMKFNIGPADKVFGPGGVQIKTQGSSEIILGVKHNRVENPALTERQRSNFVPQFDMKIQLNVNGSVGDKVNFGMNYNTESSFEFDQQMVKLAYKGKEDDIIKNIQAGNVSMQLNSSLISGSTALFGIKTDLQFGKLSISAVASQQESETKTVSSKGGAQTTEFEVNADNYDENRHFFIGHFFRENFESSVSKLPVITSGVTVNRVEVWITNKRANYDQARNIVAFMDLGEADRIDNSHWTKNPAMTIPSNNANSLYTEITGVPNVRNIQMTNSVLNDNFGSFGVSGGEDYEKIESARKLDPSEYTLNSDLGIISLKSALNPDEILGVAYEYNYRGKIYQVGEFSTDPIEAPNALVVKLLKGTTQSPQLAIWDLMLKNVYYLGSMQIQKDNFNLRIVYRNDSVGTDMQYLTEGGSDVKNKLLLRVMNLDRLDVKNNENADGIFDYIEGITALSSSGRIMFPVLEPFGKHLKEKFGPGFETVADKYIFQELYDSTLVVAQELSEKNKFRLVGEYKSSGGSEIRLNAMNVPRGSVTVTAGGATLTENVDYTVDYTMGTVNILNQSILESGTNIDVKLENQSMFSMQRKSLVGTHLEYQFSKDFSIGGTIMHLSEKPLTTKVNTGNEPISNTIWGLNTSWRTESQWLTNMLDKLPFVNATKPSTIALNAEFAQLIPGHSKIVGRQGMAYLDDFESTKTTIDIHYPVNWYLASTPFNPEPNPGDAYFQEAALQGIEYGKNRALLSWYYVDQILNSLNPGRSTPINLRNNVESQSNHYTRDVLIKEVFPNRSQLLTERALLTVMNLSYYPTERGPYNLDVDGMDQNGYLINPKNRWGGIMRKLDATDFETSNIEYIEFWMMDPFIYDKDRTDKGGDLYFNLGDISEDVLKDGKKFFEHGLPVDGDETKTETTVWGRVPKTQSTITAFDNTPGARKFQDVGLNGISTEQEKLFPAYKDYVDAVTAKLTPDARQRMSEDPFSPLNDPAGDNYRFYKSTEYDNADADILTRYKRYNGTEGNSPDATETTEEYTTTATSLPDMEDANNDNTLNEYEKYFQYKVAIRKDSMEVGRNFITDSYTSNVNLANGNVEAVTWYQFKIPIRAHQDKVGNIRNFKSIRFIRMFMTDFEQEKHLRFATLELVRGEWRNYSKAMNMPGTAPVSNGKLDVQAVNIEENSDKTPVNYILPPGITRETDPGQIAMIKLNEQAMVMKVNNLAPNDARAVYKNTAYDMRQYKRLQMFVHAEKMADDVNTLNDYDLSCFVRLGTDMVNNYYEYEIPLRLTPAGIYQDTDTDREIVWPKENMFDFPFQVLTEAKLARNRAKQDGSYVSDMVPFYHNGKNKIRVVGNPTLSDVQNIMIGVRNNSTRGEIKTGEIWVNELRMTEFDESGGSAAMANLSVGLSDLGSVNLSGRLETAGYGSIESNVMDRRMDDLYQMNFSTSLDLGRFLPEKAKIQLPAYFSYTNETLTPKYNPLDQDILLDEALDVYTRQEDRDTLLMQAQTVSTTKSFNISSARVNIKSKKPQFYDPANVTFTYAYSENNQHNPEVKENLVKQERAAINYSYSFTGQAVEPFKTVKALDKPAFKIIKELNFNYLPSSVSFNTDMNRQFSKVELRDLGGFAGAENFDLNFSKDFMWNRNFSINWDLTRSLRFSLQTAMNANIEEPYYTPEFGREHYDLWRDSVIAGIRRLGNPYTYNQVFTASWAIPINKIPLLDWVTANVSYNSNYSWNRTALIAGQNVGNIATSMGAWSGDGQLNFENLYNKSKYLKDVNRRYAMQQPANLKFQPRTFSQVYKFEKAKKLSVNHRLGSEKFDFSAKDKNGKPVLLKYRTVNPTTIELTPDFDMDSVQLTIVSKDPNYRTPSQKAVDFTSRFLMMVRRASVSYRQTNSMTLPGFTPQPGFLGQQKDQNNMFAPGYAFAFGFFDDNTIDDMANKGWLYKNPELVNPAALANTSDLDIKASVEPIPGMKIELNAKRYTAGNTNIQYMFDGMPRTFSGSYNITQISIATAFTKTGNAEQNYASEVFDQFLANRQKMADRLIGDLKNTKYPTTGFFSDDATINGKPFDATKSKYSLNSPDVLIPSFLAAYTGRDINTVNKNPFLSILEILPNWRLNYDGLSRIGWIQDKFRSVSITHAYTSRYSVGNYSSYATWVAMGDDDSALGYIREESTGNPIPSMPYEISTVSLNEQFSPLIGINAALKNSMTTKLEYRKQRNLSLNLNSTQLIESSSDEFVVGFGYLLKDFDVILKLKNDGQSRIKNDLKLNADLSYKDIKSLLRKINENVTQASSGNKMFSLKIMADYVFSSKVNIQLFFDRQTTSPLISSTYPVSATNFGMSFKFMLTR